MHETLVSSRPLFSNPTSHRRTVRIGLLAALVAAALAPMTRPAHASSSCVVADNGSHTATFPPSCLGYASRRDEIILLNGLPPGSPVIGRLRIFAIALNSEIPGGSLGGHHQDWGGRIELILQGTGAYAGYNRTLILPILTGQTDTGPRSGLLQDFKTDLTNLQAQIGGDPDFDLLRITAGTAFGMPSPGHTTLTHLPGDNWAVDSFFDITYRIDFVGHPGTIFGGMSGSTVDLMRLHQGSSLDVRCAVPDNGSGTADLPANCLDGTRSHDDELIIKDGLAVGRSIQGMLRMRNVVVDVVAPGGDLAGDIIDFHGNMDLDGWYDANTGAFTTGTPIARTLPVTGRVQVGPRPPGASVQGVPMDLLQLQGQLPIGDPDFDLLRIVSGSVFGMPSPGHTTLVRDAGGHWAVDSFFDIEYRIDFVGHPGGALNGLSGSTNSEARIAAGVADVPRCEVPDVSGTAQFPARCPDGYASPPEAIVCLNGLPPGEPVLGTLSVVIGNTSEGPGGSLGGGLQSFKGDVVIRMHGTGSMAAYARSLTIPFNNANSETGSRSPGASPQNFPSNLLTLQTQLPAGDPDFDLLRITAGSGFSQPSPGHTTLTRTGGGNWAVDSFFDIEYRIDFIGAPGGPFAGMSGSTTSGNRFHAGDVKSVTSVPPRTLAARVGDARPNPARAGAAVDFELGRGAWTQTAILDVAGRRVKSLPSAALTEGAHVVRWDGCDASGRAVSPGLYFFQLRFGDESVVRRVVVND